MDMIDLDTFMDMVEKGEKRVYSEYPTARDSIIMLVVPIVVGFSMTLLVMTTFALIEIDLAPLLALAASFLPIVAGAIVSLFLVIRSSRGVEQYGVRGMSRIPLSVAISFLDMLAEGVADVGKIIGSERPEEYNPSSSLALGASVQVLNKIDPELGTRWVQNLSARLAEEASLRIKILLRTTIYGTIIIVVCAVILEILWMLGFIDTLLFLYILVPSVIVAVILVVVLAIYALKQKNARPPPQIEHAVGEPEIRNETSFALDRLLRVFIEEGNSPLRVLVLGDYDILKYTGRTYVTSLEIALKEAVLIPRGSKTDSAQIP